MNWIKKFDERQQKEIQFCRIYAEQFGHGTDGHNAKLIIAKMAELLTLIEIELTKDDWDEEIVPKVMAVLGLRNDSHC